MDRLTLFNRVLERKEPPLRSHDPHQNPAIYYPGLESQPFHDVERFPWIAAFTRSFRTIRGELEKCLAHRRGFEPVFPGYTQGGEWAALWFYLYGVQFDDNCHLCPATCQLIEQVPRLAGWACYSALPAGAHIRPHCGVTNAKLRLHYAIKAEPGSRMRVCDKYYEWSEGEAMLFDDSYEHEVWVGGTGPRVVLILDFYHPDLQPDEIGVLKALEESPSGYLGNESLRTAYMKKRSTWTHAQVNWLYEQSHLHSDAGEHDASSGRILANRKVTESSVPRT